MLYYCLLSTNSSFIIPHSAFITDNPVSIYDDIKPLGLEGVNTYPLAERPSKVAVEDFARPFGEASSLRDFLASLPNILAVQSLRALASQMRRARSLGKPLIWSVRRHLIKVRF